ncbi:MAG: lipoprotein-releasing ABC transporter permease subunit [Candidatus Auribacterota bacterium]
MLYPSYELLITLRYLNSKRREKFVPFITMCSLIGIAISVMTLIVVIGVMAGFERDLKSKMISMNAHITIENQVGQGIDNPQQAIQALAKVAHIEHTAPFLMGEALIRTRAGGRGVVLKGINPEQENYVSELAKYVSIGEYRVTGKEVLVGSELARYFSITVGDVIVLNLPTRSATSFGMIPRELKCRVKGIFVSGLYEFDMNFVYMPLDTYQQFLGVGEMVSGINVRVDNFDRSFTVKRDIMNVLGFPYLARTWLERNQNLFRAIHTEKVVMFIILVIAIVIAAFNISSTLVMTVMEKTRDIGVIKSLGATSGSIMKIFLYQGLFVGVIGTISGVLIGRLIISRIDTIADLVSRLFGFEVFPKDIYLFDKIPAYISGFDTAIIACAAVLVSVAAAVYPAWKASILKPVEALRYE